MSAHVTHAGTDVAGAHKGSLRTYVSGFVLAVVLTAVAFAVVMGHLASTGTTLTIVFLAAAVQVVVHLHYFLHLDTSSEQRWNVSAFLFTGIVIVLIVAGSAWIMFNLQERTMINNGANCATCCPTTPGPLSTAPKRG